MGRGPATEMTMQLWFYHIEVVDQVLLHAHLTKYISQIANTVRTRTHTHTQSLGRDCITSHDFDPTLPGSVRMRRG